MPIELAQGKTSHAALIDMHIMFRMVLLQLKKQSSFGDTFRTNQQCVHLAIGHEGAPEKEKKW